MIAPAAAATEAAVTAACGALAARGLKRLPLTRSAARGIGAVLAVAAVQLAVTLHAAALGISAAAVLSVAGVCTVTDLRSGYVFDAVTLPALAALLLLAAAAGTPANAIAGAAAASGALALLYAATRGRGLGLGDVKLAACIGAAFGWAAALRALEAAFIIGGGYAAVMLAANRARRRDEMAFAPFIFAGAAAILWGGSI